MLLLALSFYVNSIIFNILYCLLVSPLFIRQMACVWFVCCWLDGVDSDLSGELQMTQASMVRARLYRRAKVKSLCMTAMIVAAFIICWTPYQVPPSC